MTSCLNELGILVIGSMSGLSVCIILRGTDVNKVHDGSGVEVYGKQ